MADNNRQQEQTAARDSIISGNDIHNEVRQIVVDALKNGQMETEHIKDVIRAVVDGAFEGAATSKHETTDALKQTVTGIDEALSQVAQATSLAIEEAAGNLEEFTEHDLKRALADLKELDKLFFDTLGEVARGGQETTANILNSLIHHLQQSSTSVGRTVSETTTNLSSFMFNSGKNIQATDVVRSTGASIARIASGFLAGIADSLSPGDKK